MAIDYIDYSGSQGSGNGSSPANRVDRMDYGYIYPGDELKIKGNPPKSLGTAVIEKDRVTSGSNGSYQLSTNSSAYQISYSTTTGQTYIGMTQAGQTNLRGYATGDWLMIITDDVLHPSSQPDLRGIHRITVTGTFANSDIKLYFDGYTGSATELSTGGTFRFLKIQSDVVQLNTSGLTKHIASWGGDRSAWTSAGTATVTLEEFHRSAYTRPQQSMSPTGTDKFVIPATQAVGKIAHYQLPSSLDLSGYQQISFLVSAAETTNNFHSNPDTIRLCTDTAGNTSVHTAPIKLRKASDHWWIASVTDLGTNMNSAIQSVALYREATQSSAQTYYIENIIACKDSSVASSFTHASKIGLNDTDQIWYDIDFIDGSNIVIKGSNGYQQNKTGYYSGGSGAKWGSGGSSIQVYRVEPFHPPDDMLPTSNTEDVDEPRALNENLASNTNRYTISGGWNEAYDTQNCVTIFEGSGNGTGFTFSDDYMTIEKLHVRGFYYGQDSRNTRGLEIVDCGYGSCRDKPGYFDDNEDISKMRIKYIIRGSDRFQSSQMSVASYANQSDWFIGYSPRSGWEFDAEQNPTYGERDIKWDYIEGWPASHQAYGTMNYWDSVYIGTLDQSYGYSGSQASQYFYRTDKVTIGTYRAIRGGYMYTSTGGDKGWVINQLDIKATDMDGYYFQGSAFDTNPTIHVSNDSADFYFGGGEFYGQFKSSGAKSAKLNGVTHTGGSSNLIEFVSGSDGLVQWKDFNGVSGAHRNYSPSHLLEVESSIRKTSSGSSLKATPRDTTSTPFGVKLGSILVNSGSAVTISIWTFATTTGETISLYVPQNSYFGFSSDQEATNAGYSVNTWTQISKTFTPTQQGELEVYVKFTNNSTSSAFYVDDFSVSQA